jgi:polysaccharide export outer membrane protein
MNRFVISIFLVVIGTVSALSQSQQQQAPGPDTEGPDAPQATRQASPNDYVLRKDDIVTITVYREPDLTTTATISADNSIQFPLLGEVAIGDMTIREAREKIRRQLDADYIVNPHVTLSVQQYANRTITLLGQVRSPGTYPLPGGEKTTLMDAIGMAGGFGRSANMRKIMVRRTLEDGREVKLTVDLKKIRDEGGKKFYLMNEDVITVSETWW